MWKKSPCASQWAHLAFESVKKLFISVKKEFWKKKIQKVKAASNLTKSCTLMSKASVLDLSKLHSSLISSMTQDYWSGASLGPSFRFLGLAAQIGIVCAYAHALQRQTV
jgi:hypothetical protein